MNRKGMDDYISREAVKEAAWEGFINRLVEDQGMYGYLVSLVNEVFDAIPAADVRPVVACCDCKHFQINVSPSGYLPQGVPEWECRYWCRPTDPTDFCSYGEKREGS